jgi:hypothetical protein
MSGGRIRAFVRTTSITQEGDQLLLLFMAEMTDLFSGTVTNGFIQNIEQIQARLRQSDADDSAVAGMRFAFDEFPLFEFIDHPRDVRSASDQPTGELQGGEGLWVLGTEETQDVVLLSGEVVLLKEVRFENAQTVVGSPKLEEDLLLR